MLEIIAVIIYFVSAVAIATIFGVCLFDANKYVKEQLKLKPHLSKKDFRLSWFDWILLVILITLPCLNVVFALNLILEIDDIKEAIFDEVDRRLNQ